MSTLVEPSWAQQAPGHAADRLCQGRPVDAGPAWELLGGGLGHLEYLETLSPHRIRSRPGEPLGQLQVLKEIDKTKVELSSAPRHPSLSSWIKP